MNTRLVAAFRGSAQCRRETGAVQWRLRGLDRDSGDRLEVLLSGAAALQLPGELAGAELHVRDALTGAGLELRGGGQSLPLAVRAVQVHRGAAVLFEHALPRITASWKVRAGWVLLLNALRVPGVARLLQKLRSRGNAS